MDPGLESILPARRIARQLGVEARFLVGDARYIPFRDGRFEVVYSYGVLQHFSPTDAKLAIAEAGRVVAPSGTVLIQMAARYGLLSMLQQARRGFRDARGFEVHYWRPSEIEAAFESLIGPTVLSVDGFLTLNPQPSDLDLLPFHFRQIVRFSEAMRALSRRIPALLEIADSIFASSIKAGLSQESL
jgi:SAM-dependent methyltransferase